MSKSMSYQGSAALVHSTTEKLEEIESELRTEQLTHADTGYQDIVNELVTQVHIAQERLQLRLELVRRNEELRKSQ